MLRESAGARVSRQMARRGLVLLVAGVALVSACGSGDEQPSSESSTAPGDTEATAPVAGAQENAVTSGAMCYGWPNGTTDAQPCAVGLKGPGGGRVFYDAGSEQPWGRFLEVAPQMWGPRGYDCRWCGAADGVPRYTTDENGAKQGYYLCRTGSNFGADRVLLPGEAGKTDEAIGAGRGNTEVLSKTAECVDGSTSALTLATGYQGYGGLSDWYLPSVQELTALCKYEGRSAIGGFLGSDVNGTKPYYHSSTVGPKGDYTVFYGVDFGGNPATCSRQEMLFDENQNYHGFVRPIRAFA